MAVRTIGLGASRARIEGRADNRGNNNYDVYE